MNTSKQGAGREATLATNVGVTAQSLRHLDILTRRLVTARLGQYEFLVPSPEAYAMHKIVVNGERGKKAQKDRDAIVGLWPYLSHDEMDRLEQTLPKREWARYQAFVKANGVALRKRDGDFGALDRLRAIVASQNASDEGDWPNT